LARLAGRIALVTGASRGLGAAVARRFAAEGAQLVLVAREAKSLEAIDDSVGGAATLVPLDLRDFAKIDQLGAALAQRFGRLDIVVGAAAMLGMLSPLGHADPALWQEVIDVNLTANYRLLRALDPLLRASDAGRAIFVTCHSERAALPYWGAYATSKAALEAMVRIYAGENAQSTIRANLVDPGPLRTQLRADAFPHEKPETLPLPAEATEQFVALASAECRRNGEIVRAELPRHPAGA
jgi:NAD(P)-dependent dehydrogenase (short-subunit alcohol dehydrogenase family)